MSSKILRFLGKSELIFKCKIERDFGSELLAFY